MAARIEELARPRRLPAPLRHDSLILTCPPELKYRLEAEVEDLMEGLPFDCIYLDEVRPDRRARLLEEAQDASPRG